MCGRMILKHRPRDLAVYFGLKAEPLVPIGTVTPGRMYPIIIGSDYPVGSMEAIPANWGLIPDGYDIPGFQPPFNARIETIDEKDMFVDTYPCIIPCTAILEGNRWVQRSDAGLITLAGLATDSSTFGPTFAMLTMDSIDGLERLHHRMPVTVYDFTKWLSSREIDLARNKYVILGGGGTYT